MSPYDLPYARRVPYFNFPIGWPLRTAGQRGCAEQLLRHCRQYLYCTSCEQLLSEPVRTLSGLLSSSTSSNTSLLRNLSQLSFEPSFCRLPADFRRCSVSFYALNPQKINAIKAPMHHLPMVIHATSTTDYLAALSRLTEWARERF